MGRGLFALVACAGSLLLAGCGSTDQTQFVLQTTSASPSGSAAASGASPASSGVPASPGAPGGAAATPIPDGRRIIIDTPDASSSISSPVAVSGTASVDKGTVVAVVLDGAGTELGRATTTASASAPDYGHYDVSVSFSGAASGSSGKLQVFGVSARDGTTPTYFYYIAVRFP